MGDGEGELLLSPLLLRDLGDVGCEEDEKEGAGEEERDDKSDMVVGLLISSGMMLNSANIGGEEEPRVCVADLGFELELEVRTSDTLLAREHRASESILAKAFRFNI